MEALEAVCDNVPSSFVTECQDFVDTYGTELLKYVFVSVQRAGKPVKMTELLFPKGGRVFNKKELFRLLQNIIA